MCELYSAPSFRGVQVGRILQLLGRITHNGCKKLEGPLQKAALVSNVCNSENRKYNPLRRIGSAEQGESKVKSNSEYTWQEPDSN